MPLPNRQRVWFITGGSSGFGRAISTAALKQGDSVVATSRNPKSLDDLVAQNRDRVQALELDVTDPEAARQAVAEATARFGEIDVVVNNAGYGHVGAIEELGDDELRQQLDVNLFGVINVTRAALPRMRRQGSGHLVQMSSLNGIEGLVGGGFYAASKFAIEGLSESLADEVAALGIRVTIVEPGPHRTGFAGRTSMKWADPIGAYDESVGEARAALSQLDGNQPGDPARAAKAIIRVVDMDDPPRRLPLGQMALDNIRAKLNAQLEELETWRELSATSDYPEDGQRQEASGQLAKT